MKTKTHKKIASLLSLAMIVLFVTIPTGAFSATTVTVSGDTSAGENMPGWLFNRDTSTDTPFEFNTDESSIGDGSLYVEPISSNASDKFIGENFINAQVADVNSISYDFQIGDAGEESDANQFYMSVYANFGVSDDNKFYDCRYNVVPTTGSTTDFTTVTFDPTQSYDVTTRGGASASPYTCPSVPADMDTLSSGSNVRVFALNVGDTSTSDEGLDGYLDNVVVDLDSDVTTSDFEAFAASAQITSPIASSTQSGVVNFTANYVDEDGNDSLQWAVRSGTCAAGTGTQYGNVDGKTTAFNWNGASFSSSIDMTNNTPGQYCFIFNPTEDSGDSDIRLMSQFTLVATTTDPEEPTPGDKNSCKANGWKDLGFKNQGQCIKHANTGKDSR